MQLHPSSLHSIYLEWDLEGDFYKVYRSGAPDTDFTLIADQIEQPFYEDTDVNLYDSNIRYYYKVEGYSAEGVLNAEDGPETLFYNEPDGVAHKVIWEFRTALRVMRNPPVFFLMKRRYGKRCPDCWNAITGKTMYSNCPTCNGTGYIDGYHKPVQTRISQDVSQLRMASGELDNDKTSLSPIRAWIPNTPLLHPEDVMVDIMNQRYKVVNVIRRTKSQFILRQIVELAPLDKGHSAYQLEVDRKVKNKWNGRSFPI